MFENQNLGSKPSLKQLVYENLQNMIVQGKLEPGEKLIEDDLAQAKHISRAPIREAISMLERDGFVRIIPRKGAIVAEVSEKDAMDIWKCRLALEPFAAREAMPHIPTEELEAALKRISKIEKDYSFEEYVASDLEVHGLYYGHLDNEYMKSILNNLKAHSIRVRWLKEVRNSFTDMSRSSIREHRQIIEAFLSGDGDRVYTTVQQHILNSAARLKDPGDSIFCPPVPKTIEQKA